MGFKFPIVFQRFKSLSGYFGRSVYDKGTTSRTPRQKPRDYYAKKKSRRKMAVMSRRANRG